MSEFKVDSDRIKVLSSDLVGVSNSVGNVLSELSYMNLNGYTESVNMQPQLNSVCRNVSALQRRIYLYGESLGTISELYTNAEKGMDLSKVKQDLSGQSKPGSTYGTFEATQNTAVKVNRNQNKSYASWRDFFGNLRQDSIQTIVEQGSWPLLVQMFKKGIVKKASTFLKIDSVMGVTGKVGLPIVGGIIDYVSMVKSGEGGADSFVKAGAHSAVGWYAGTTCTALGAVVGAGLGSVVPGLGTAVGGFIGAGVGLLAGSLASTVINGAVDIAYDQIYSKYVNKTVNEIKTVETAVKTGEAVLDGMGHALRTGIVHLVGSIFR